jgi:hypothetical protein
MAEDPARLAEQFIRRMDARGVSLDYAPHTLAFLPLHGAELSDGLARELAGYYGEVVRRHLGGTWEPAAEPSRFPRLRVAEDRVIRPLERAEQLRSEAGALAREFGELALELPRPAEVFDEVARHLGEQAEVGTGLLVRWLALRRRLPDPLLEALLETPGTAGEVFRTVLGGRLTSTEVTLEADRFLRCYLLSPELGATWLDDLASLSVTDDDPTFAQIAELLDRRWQEWHAAGCPGPPG